MKWLSHSQVAAITGSINEEPRYRCQFSRASAAESIARENRAFSLRNVRVGTLFTPREAATRSESSRLRRRATPRTVLCRRRGRLTSWRITRKSMKRKKDLNEYDRARQLADDSALEHIRCSVPASLPTPRDCSGFPSGIKHFIAAGSTAEKISLQSRERVASRFRDERSSTELRGDLSRTSSCLRQDEARLCFQ